jgi:hypothetical protein
VIFLIYSIILLLFTVTVYSEREALAPLTMIYHSDPMSYIRHFGVLEAKLEEDEHYTKWGLTGNTENGNLNLSISIGID